MTYYYHFVEDTLRDGTAIPPDGEWLEETRPLKLCSVGLHASAHVADALQYAPGATLCLVELAGEIVVDDDKVCASRRKIVARFDATELLLADARASALSVIHLWDAPPVVRQYLETGDESMKVAARGAAAAAWYAAAARDAAAVRDAAWAAAYAAWDAAYAAAAARNAADATQAAVRDAAAARAAADAARDAAWDAARAAAYAAWDAAYAAAAAWDAAAARAAADAARDAWRLRLALAVEAKFATMGVTV